MITLLAAAAFYFGDSSRSTILGNISAVYKTNSAFWIGSDFYGGQMKSDKQNGLNLKTKESLYLVDLAFYWNLPARLGTDQPDSAYADFYASIGPGILWIGSRRKFTGFMGGGMDIHTPWNGLVIHTDLKNYFFTMKNSKGGDFNSDIALGLGVGFAF